jgi:hypothetical protein
VFGFSVRQALNQQRFWLIAVLLAIPPGIIGLVRSLEPDSKAWENYHGVMQFGLLAFAIPMICMFYGAEMIGADVEARTIGYLLTRRMRRSTLLIVRFLAGWLTLSMLVLVSALAVFAAAFAGADMEALAAKGGPDRVAWQPWSELGVYFSVLPLAVGGFLSVFGFIGLVAPKPLILSVSYFVVGELFLANLPAAVRRYSISHHVRASMFHRIPGLFKLYELPREIREQLYPEGCGGWIPLGLVIVVAVVLGCLLITKRELVPAKLARE